MIERIANIRRNCASLSACPLTTALSTNNEKNNRSHYSGNDKTDFGGWTVLREIQHNQTGNPQCRLDRTHFRHASGSVADTEQCTQCTNTVYTNCGVSCTSDYMDLVPVKIAVTGLLWSLGVAPKLRTARFTCMRPKNGYRITPQKRTL